MTVQYSVTSNNNALDSRETTLGTAPLLRFYTGAQPANCATAASGTQLASQALPSDFQANASSASKTKSGTWSGTYSAAGNVGYYRMYDSTGTTCHEQGSVTATGGGGDMTVDNVVAANGQGWTVNTFTKNAGNQ